MKKNIFILAALFLIGATLQAQTNTTNASGSFRATVTTSDSAEQLKPSAVGITSKYVIVQALPTNTGYVAVGVTKGRITAASVDTPIVIVSAGHGLVTGQRISIVGVQGNTAANGSWPVTVISADTLTIDSAAGNAAYYRGGIWTDVSTTAGYERGDLLSAGGSTVIIVDDVSQVWINGTAGDGVIWRYGRGDAPTAPISGTSSQAAFGEIVDTLSNRFPASKPRTLLDSIKTTNATLTAHAAGDEFSSATTSPGTRGFTDAVLTTGGQAWLDQLVAWTDSLITTTIEVSWYTDSVASNNDNAAFQTLLAAASKFLGSTVIQLNPGGAGSTVSTGRVYGDLLKVSSTTTKLWYRIKVLTATTFKHQGGIFLKPTFKYF